MLLFVSFSPEFGLQAFEMLHQNAKSKFPEAGRVIEKRSNEGLLGARNHNYDDGFCDFAWRLFTAFRVTNAVILVVPKNLL